MLGGVFVDVDKIDVGQEKFTGGCKIWTQKSGIVDAGVACRPVEWMTRRIRLCLGYVRSICARW